MASFNPSSLYGTRRVSLARAVAAIVEDDSGEELDSDVEPNSDVLPDLENDSDISVDVGDIVMSDHDTDSEAGMSVDGDVDDDEDDDNTFVTAKSGRKWSCEPPRQRRTAAVNIVTEQEGVNPDVAQCVETISDNFGVYVTDKMIEDIVRCTNQYMDRQYVDDIDTTTATAEFRHTDQIELKALLGLLIAIGESKGRNETIVIFDRKDPSVAHFLGP